MSIYETTNNKLTSRQTAVMEHIAENNGFLPLHIQQYFTRRTLESLVNKGLLIQIDACLIETLESVSTDVALKALELHGLKECMYVTYQKSEEVAADAFLMGNPPQGYNYQETIISAEQSCQENQNDHGNTIFLIAMSLLSFSLILTVLLKHSKRFSQNGKSFKTPAVKQTFQDQAMTLLGGKADYQKTSLIQCLAKKRNRKKNATSTFTACLA